MHTGCTNITLENLLANFVRSLSSAMHKHFKVKFVLTLFTAALWHFINFVLLLL